MEAAAELLPVAEEELLGPEVVVEEHRQAQVERMELEEERQLQEEAAVVALLH